MGNVDILILKMYSLNLTASLIGVEMKDDGEFK